MTMTEPPSWSRSPAPAHLHTHGLQCSAVYVHVIAVNPLAYTPFSLARTGGVHSDFKSHVFLVSRHIQLSTPRGPNDHWGIRDREQEANVLKSGQG